MDQDDSRVQEALNEIELWRSFMQHPGWKLLCEFLDVQIEQRRIVYESRPDADGNAPYVRSFLTGEVSMALTLKQLPETRTQSAQDFLGLQKLTETEDGQ